MCSFDYARLLFDAVIDFGTETIRPEIRARVDDRGNLANNGAVFIPDQASIPSEDFGIIEQGYNKGGLMLR